MFLLFTYEGFYPKGGWNDFYDSYETLSKAEEVGRQQARGRDGDPNDFYWQVVDADYSRVVSAGRAEPYCSKWAAR